MIAPLARATWPVLRKVVDEGERSLVDGSPVCGTIPRSELVGVEQIADPGVTPGRRTPSLSRRELSRQKS